MKKLEKTATLVALGSWGYPLLEIAWRGWSHWSMALAGGMCFGLLGRLSERMKQKNPFLRCAAGSMTITTVELLFGCIFNLGLHMNVWDYSEEMWNLGGQICMRYSIIWFVLSAPLMRLADWLGGEVRQRDRMGERRHASGNQRTKYVYHIGMLPKGRAENSDPAGDGAAPYC